MLWTKRQPGESIVIGGQFRITVDQKVYLGVEDLTGRNDHPIQPGEEYDREQTELTNQPERR